jgi:hypothetical protein
VSSCSTLIILESIFLGLGGYVFFLMLSSEVSFEFYLERLAAIVELSGFSEFITYDLFTCKVGTTVGIANLYLLSSTDYF